MEHFFFAPPSPGYAHTFGLLRLAAAMMTTLLVCTAPSFAADQAVNAHLPRDLRVPGGVAIMQVAPINTPKPVVTRENARVWVAPGSTHWLAVVGISLSTPPGEQSIQINEDGRTRDLTFRVTPKKYPVQRLKLNKAMVDPPADVMARIEREAAHLKTVRNTWRDTGSSNAQFMLPAQGPLSSRFGVARVLNGKPRSPHAGLDVAVNTGTRVVAAQSGVVIDTGDYYFCGKGLFIDHGNSLITLYCHLNDFTAKVGDTVKQGDAVALSGSTGRSTAPHLHWTVMLNGVSVEPELFLRK